MRTITALFDSYEQAAGAVRELEAAGFPSGSVSLVVSTLDDELGDASLAQPDVEDAATEGAGAGAGIGAVLGGTGGLLAGLGALAIPGLGPVIAAGWLVSTAAGAVAGAALGGATGGLIGSLTGSGVGEEDAHVFAEGVRRGGSVVSARAEEDRVEDVEAIFGRMGQVDLIERRRIYEQEGWSISDPGRPGSSRYGNSASGPF
ncbi:MAG TPA: hypothetical protein VGN79_06455 [Devosia sp.]|jgi:hypothetical protein|nr:hypothetical protein [Devosia sp.]